MQDTRLSNNIIHLRTCPDSARALSELINYLASNEDMRDMGVANKASSDGTSTPKVHVARTCLQR